MFQICEKYASSLRDAFAADGCLYSPSVSLSWTYKLVHRNPPYMIASLLGIAPSKSMFLYRFRPASFVSDSTVLRISQPISKARHFEASPLATKNACLVLAYKLWMKPTNTTKPHSVDNTKMPFPHTTLLMWVEQHHLSQLHSLSSYPSVHAVP